MVEFFPSRAVAVELFGFAIHWYGLMYLLGFLVAYFLLPRLQRYRNIRLSRDDWASLLSVVIAGVIAGGRLGFVLFYEPVYFFAHPLEIFAIWQGGMSSHGGFIGVTLAILWFCWRKNISVWKLADIVVIPAAIGLAFGRMGNFINQELYGIPTSLPWGIAVPGVEDLRHPTQIYAVIKNLTIAFCCYLHLRSVRMVAGQTAGLFLTLYAVFRFIVEMYRIQLHGIIDIFGLELSRGQWLTIPLFVVGVSLMIWAGNRHKGL